MQHLQSLRTYYVVEYIDFLTLLTRTGYHNSHILGASGRRIESLEKMRTKRKRIEEHVTDVKRQKVSDSVVRRNKAGPLSHEVLSSCYPEVRSLRQYLVDSLPLTSRARRRKTTTYVLDDGSNFLETTLVGTLRKAKPGLEEERRREFVHFTQSQQRSTHSSDTIAEQDRMKEVRFC